MAILPEHKEILLTQSESKTLLDWYNFFDKRYTKSQIYSFCYCNNKLIKKNIQTQSQHRKYHINQDFFKIWSHDVAYVLGLWWADGCLYNEQNFDITLRIKDKYILKKIAKILKYEGSLQDCVDRQVAKLNFSCAIIYNDLINLIGSSKKTIRIFYAVPSEYLPDFIRGYFDGKGNVYNKKGGRINTAFTSDNKIFLDVLLTILKEKAGVQGGSYDASSTSLRFGNKDSLKIGNYIYRDNPELFLLRKRSKFNL